MEVTLRSFDQVQCSDPHIPVYFHTKYVECHQVKTLYVVEGKANNMLLFTCLFSIKNRQATSMTRSPFGSVIMDGESSYEMFNRYWVQLENLLLEQNVTEILIIHPVKFYPSFVPHDWMTKIGLEALYSDHNQWVDLNVTHQLHKMELRKLHRLKNQNCTIEQTQDFKQFFDFLSSCRSEQGLAINIDYPTLTALKLAFPNNFEIWIVKKDHKWISAVLMTKVCNGIWYYYLPGTLNAFKSLSPMVLLLDHLINHYKKTSDIIDLGVSSIQGEKQTGLYQFKKHMGAQDMEKITFQKRL